MRLFCMTSFLGTFDNGSNTNINETIIRINATIGTKKFTKIVTKVIGLHSIKEALKIQIEPIRLQIISKQKRTTRKSKNFVMCLRGVVLVIVPRALIITIHNNIQIIIIM